MRWGSAVWIAGGSDGASCVELALSPSRILLRESDDLARILPVTRHGVAALIRHLGGYASEPKFWVQ
ncbi:DUF397 domain-containing protein [Streptomyces sp. 11x1]|uniref:DUF397 domain-containing protein n=1 Tax=Streptomyces sp. 11x1 TaxID=3038642 RepID=UPI00292F99EA|nr:DUF397 domain-containing protein [Streptomyces sp. 11x1]WNZ10100.1 DUF397 domain-containing protein [Streptomyces sp. 11x1]